MLKYEDIVDAPVSQLKAAADDWDEMFAKLTKLATAAEEGMKAKADKAEWEGVNAGITKKFIGKTAQEFKDAAAEAKGVKKILNEAHTAIKKARDDLVNIRDDEGRAAGIHVDAKGKVTARHPLGKDDAARREPDYAELLRNQREAVEMWQKKVDVIVDNCNDVDAAVKRALEANVSEGRDFSAPKYKNLDQEEAAYAANLASKGPGITHTELQSLNEVLRERGKSPEFAKAFYEKLGPEESLTFFGQLSTSAHEYGKVDKERLADVQALQRNLGLNLATASHDKAFSVEWGPELRRLGTEQIPLAKNDRGGAYGYQLLGGIMRYGNYDAKFLNPIAEHVMQLHQKNPNFFANTNQATAYVGNPFNPSAQNGSGFDPTTAMLEALGHSPDAAKKFFTDDPTAYNDDGTVNKEGTADLGKGEGGEPIEKYLDFFGNDKWKSFPDTGLDNPGASDATRQYMPDALGHALESATLGYPYDSPDAKVVRDSDNAAIMQQVMEKYGSDAGLLNEQKAMADSLGVMGAGYIDDINWALEKNENDSVFAPSRNLDGHLKFDDLNGTESRSIARDFLSVLGQHPDAYATISKAEQIYTTSVLETQVGDSGKIDIGGARAAVGTGAEVQGMLDQSRADQVGAEYQKKHEEYEKAVAARSGWVEFGATTALVAGVAFLPVTAAVGAAAVLIPLATDTAAAGMEQLIGQVIGDVSANSVDENKEKIEDLNEEQRKRIYFAGEYMAEAPMERFLNYHAADVDSKFKQDLKESMRIGYAAGNDRENQQGSDPETG
ncbi:MULTISPECIES: DUF6571 family protein [unclassified Streptomyces]|uniref:DUF6571 family protein n=1 Tax=unclassified Streptomyces TaxID=2593676 RepID=UPI00093F4C13|nr:DUF6571 family protein [Streptomyces sp. TSRI0281]OKI38538.1 hypothetical protein A6A29_11410 [Streptomyces sp. TSRI0281]